jgi:hypothetical protein
MPTPQEAIPDLIERIDKEIESMAQYAINLRQAIGLLENLQTNFVQPVLAEQLAIFRRNLAIAQNQIVEMQSQKNTLLEKLEQANRTPQSGFIYRSSGR